MNVLIIEDEQITAESLRDYIKELRPAYNILAIINSVEDALEYLKNKPHIDVIFSDIQLSDGISFEIFQQAAINAPIIFCTAYNNYMMEAFETNGLAYILKPFDAASVRSAIEKLEKISGKSNNQVQQLLQYLNNPKEKPAVASLLVHQKDKIIPISFSDIAVIFLDNSMVKLFTFYNQTWYATQSLEEIEKIKPNFFFRANRQIIIQRKAIKEISHHFNRKLLVHLNISFSEQILISKEKASLFLEWLANS